MSVCHDFVAVLRSEQVLVAMLAENNVAVVEELFAVVAVMLLQVSALPLVV